MNNLRDSYFSKDSVGADLLLCQVSVQLCCFFVFRFMMPEENLVCFVYAFISSSWWFDAHSTKIFSVIGLQRRLLHVITAKRHTKWKFETQIRFLVYISKGFFDWSMTFCSENLKKDCRLLFKLDLNNFASPAVFDPLNGYQRLFKFLSVLRIKLARRSLVWFTCFFKTIDFWFYNF